MRWCPAGNYPQSRITLRFEAESSDMSLSFLVILAARQVPTSDAWQAAVREHHVPLQFTRVLNFATNSGFVPVKVDGHESGFYFGKEDYAELVGHYPALSKISLQGPVAFSLGFGGHGLECASAAYSAALLVARFNAVAFDPQGASFMSEQQLVEAAKVCEELGG
jgi:hypothetical protein